MTKYIFLSLGLLLFLAPQVEAKTVYYQGAYPTNYTNDAIYYSQPTYPAYPTYPTNYNGYPYPPVTVYQPAVVDKATLIAQINALLLQLQAQQQYQYQYQYTQPYYYTTSSYSSRSDEPEATNRGIRNVDNYSAELRGEVDMNDFDAGTVFFVYGQSKSNVRNVANDYEQYRDINQNGDWLQKVLVDSNLDGYRSYYAYVSGLERNSRYYYSMCVEYDDDGDDTITCDDVDDFITDYN